MVASARSEHLVQFYEDDARLLASLAAFISSGLAAGEAGIVIATCEHREELDRRLRFAGVDVDAAQASGAFVTLDAAETLSRILVAGVPHADRFLTVIGSVIDGAAGRARPPRVFGEMVGPPFARGHISAAVRLEELWNELQKTHAFRLFCAYRLDPRDGRGLAPAI